MLFKLAFLVCLGLFLGVVWESPTAQKQLIREVQHVRAAVNKTVKQYEGWQVIAVSVGLTLIAYRLYLFLHHEEKSLWQRLKERVFKTVRSLPFVRKKIKNELEKTRKMMAKSFLTPKPGETFHLALPEKGLSYEEIMTELDHMDKLETYDWRGGYTSGCAYNCSQELTKITCDVYSRYCWTNPLHADVFPQVRKMEAEIVHWTAQLFNGGPDACGCVTSGGTESIMMAMKAYRQIGYDRGVRFPEFICSTSAHAAFDKAAHFFRMKIVRVSCDPLTRKINMRALSRAINSNTVALVASAPAFPHGIIDPIEDMGKLALKKKVGLHVDCCLGGFLLPFMDKAGFPLDPFDFRVPGVTTISADTHKYGFSPKGSSVLLYSNAELRRKQFFVITDWEGGIYPSVSFAGSRPGGIIASTWAAMMSMGVDGYVQTTRDIVTTTRWMVSELSSTPYIYVVGNPLVSVVAIGSKDFNIYNLSEEMNKKGWNLSSLQFPPSLHLSVTHIHTRKGVAQRFISDIKESIGVVMKDSSGKVSDTAAMYGTAQSIPDRSIITDFGHVYLDITLTATPTDND